MKTLVTFYYPESNCYKLYLLQSLKEKAKLETLLTKISKSPLSTDIFIPIAMHRKYIKWIPRDEGGGIEYQTSNSQDPRVIKDTQWGPHGEKPSCTKYLNFLVLLEGETLPIVLSFAMTSYQAGRKLYTMCKMANRDMWGKKYRLGSIAKTNNKGTFHVFDVSEAGDTSDRDTEVAEILYESFSTRDLNFEVENTNAKTSTPKDEDF